MILTRAQHQRAAESCYHRASTGLAHLRLPPSACAAEGLPYDALHALQLAAHARHVRQTAHVHRKSDALERYVSAYADEGFTILEIAQSRKVNFSPYLLARLFVERLLGVKRSEVGAYMRTPSLIPDVRLRGEVAACVEADAYCSPLVDRVKAWAGEEHEWRLQAALARGGRGVPRAALFTEEELRARAPPPRRTPDVLLRWPAVVACAHGAPALVTWLDSKAAFGEEHAVAEAAAQVADYARLFGPGAVVWWGGHVEELARACCEGPPRGAAPLVFAEPPQLLRWATLEEAAALREALAEDAAREEGGSGLWLEQPPAGPPGERVGALAAAAPPPPGWECAAAELQRQDALREAARV